MSGRDSHTNRGGDVLIRCVGCCATRVVGPHWALPLTCGCGCLMFPAEEVSNGEQTNHIEMFYADPVNEDGEVIGTARVWNVRASWADVTVVKVPHHEIVLDPGRTIRARLDDGEVSDAR